MGCVFESSEITLNWVKLGEIGIIKGLEDCDWRGEVLEIEG